MSEKKQQILTGFTDDQLERIKEFQHKHKLGSRSEAIRELIEYALKANLK